ncbi:MAG: hypothetical protein ABIR18_15940 [Chitinophagaceae bacterium]
MRKLITPGLKAVLLLLIGFVSTGIFFNDAFAQQYFVSNDANTYSQRDASGNISPVTITSFAAFKGSGYNEITWGSLQESGISKFIVEYSWNGTDYISAGEINPVPPYSFKHYMNDNRPVLYRLKAEQSNGKFSYSNSIALKGIQQSPVKVYPTILTGNQVNVNASWPVERIGVTSQNGTEVYIKVLNGQTDYITLAIPSLNKGMYFVTCYGKGWRTTDKILVP